MRRRSASVVLHPAAPRVDRQRLREVIERAAVIEPAPVEPSAALLTQFQVAFESSLASPGGLRLRGKGAALGAAGLRFGLGLSGCAPLARYAGARSTLERLARRAAGPVPRHLGRGAAHVSALRRYLFDSFRRGVALGMAFGDAVVPLVRPAAESDDVDALLACAASVQALLCFDADALTRSTPEEARRSLERYLAREHVVAFAMGYLDVPRALLERDALVEGLRALPHFHEGVEELAMHRAERALPQVWMQMRASGLRYVLPLAYLREAVSDGRDARAGREAVARETGA